MKLFVFLVFLTSTVIAQKVLEVPLGDSPVSSFFLKTDQDGFVCFATAGRNSVTGKSSSSFFLVEEDSLVKVFGGYERFEVWSIASTVHDFLILSQDKLNQFELFTLNKTNKTIKRTVLPLLSENGGAPLGCLQENGRFYLISYLKDKRERTFIVTTVDSTGVVAEKRFENMIPLIDKKLREVPGLAEIETGRRASMIEWAQQKKFQKRGDYIHLFIEGFAYNLGEIYDLTEVFSMNLETGQSTFRTIPEEKELGTSNTNSALIGDQLFRLTIYKNFLEFKIYDFESGRFIKSFSTGKKEKISIKNSPIYSKTQKGIEFENESESSKRLLARISNGYGYLFNDYTDQTTINFKVGAYIPPTAYSVSYFGSGILESVLISAAATLMANAVAATSYEYNYFNVTLNARDFSPLAYSDAPRVVKKLDVFEQYQWNNGNRISELIQYSTDNGDYVTFYNRQKKAIEIHHLN
ncbi:MAG: hypothetical protein R2820_11170 [Cyclobacteriaceae bacterium]